MTVRLASSLVLVLFALVTAIAPAARAADAGTQWIRPADAESAAVWGIRGGIVFGLWPYAVETGWPEARVRPRGLIRVGYEQNGLTFYFGITRKTPEELLGRQ